MKIDPRIGHLSSEQINDLMKRYYHGEETVKLLLEEFHINVASNGLPSLFPPITHKELFCDYCEGQNLISTRPSRQNHRCLQDNPICPSCSHANSNDCRCVNCKEKEAKHLSMIQSTKEDYLLERYAHVYFELPKVTEISLKDAVFTLSLVRHSLSEDLLTVDPFQLDQLPLAPFFDFQNEITKHLYSKGFICISEESSVDAFIFNDKLTEADSYYPNMVTWNFLPGNTPKGKRAFISDLEELVSNEEWPDSWKADINTLWKHIAKMECFEYFEYLMNQRNFEIKAFGDKTHTVFESILRNFSIGQTFNLSWQAVRDTTDFIVKEGTPKYKANNYFIGNLHRKAERFVAEGWNVKHSRRDYNCPQSVVSSTFFNFFLALGDSVLETTPPS